MRVCIATCSVKHEDGPGARGNQPKESTARQQPSLLDRDCPKGETSVQRISRFIPA